VDWDNLLYDQIRLGKKHPKKKYRTIKLRNNVMNSVSLPFTWTSNGEYHQLFPEIIAIFNGRGIHNLMYYNVDFSENDPHSDVEYFTDVERLEYLRRVKISSIDGNWYQKYSHLNKDKNQY
jgi:hypothetical protein